MSLERFIVFLYIAKIFEVQNSKKN